MGPAVPAEIQARNFPVLSGDFIALEVITLLAVAVAVSMWLVRVERSPVCTPRLVAAPATSDAGAAGSRSWSSAGQIAQARWQAHDATWELAFADDRALIHLEHKEEVAALLIDRATVTDAGLRALVRCPRLEHLRIRHTPIGDKEVEILCHLRQLRMLNLPHAVFTDLGLQRLAAMPNLEMLRFGSPHVTDEGVVALAAAPRLRFLHIIDTPIGDRSIDALARCANLESLYIDGGRFDDRSVVQLLERRPGLHLHLDQQHHDRDPRRLIHGPHVPLRPPADW